MYALSHATAHVYVEVKKQLVGDSFLYSTMWALEIDLRLSDMVINTFIH